MIPSKKKVIVIGLDGATFDIIDPLITKGKLPNLAALIREGTRGVLKSTLMPNSYPAWNSCITGVNPGKHGIFWSLIRKDNNSYPLQLMNSLDVKAKKLWQILSDHEYQVGVVNVPSEYPPTPVNGFLVCGALTPDSTCEFTFPEELKNEILKKIPGYKCEIDYAQISLEELADQLMQSIENREKLITHLLENKPWDLFFTVFTESDLAQHKFWAGIDKNHPNHKLLKKRFGNLVNEIYERLDQSVGKIIRKIPEETTIFLISDHGFGPFYQSFSLNQWLANENYLVLREFFLKKWLKNILIKTNLQKKVQILKSHISHFFFQKRSSINVRTLREKDVLSGEKLVKKINWKKTRAYFTSDYGIRINLKGREPNGTVIPGIEENELKKEIKEKLSRFRYSNSFPVFEAILFKEEAFSGPFVEKAPDLIVPINYAKAPSKPEKWAYTMTHPTLLGTHTPYGIIICKGKEIVPGGCVQNAEIIDITPTILYMLNVPLTEDMDGSVLNNIFKSEFNKQKKITKKGSSLKSPTKKRVHSKEDEEMIEQRLRDLGYID
jgi:predicted AlkP superfamily phosphohydrolase/phosphomutase